MINVEQCARLTGLKSSEAAVRIAARNRGLLGGEIKGQIKGAQYS